MATLVELQKSTAQSDAKSSILVYAQSAKPPPCLHIMKNSVMENELNILHIMKDTFAQPYIYVYMCTQCY